jgi:hypothetical protein
VHVQPVLTALVAKLGGGAADVSTIFHLDAAIVDRCLGTLLGGCVSRQSTAALLCACGVRVLTMLRLWLWLWLHTGLGLLRRHRPCIQPGAEGVGRGQGVSEAWPQL